MENNIMVFFSKFSKVSERVRPALKCGASLTDQSFEKECRIDRILYKYTHNLPLESWQKNNTPAVFGDFTKMPTNPVDIRNWYNGLQDKFQQLPAEVRREYHDDIGRFAAALLEDGEGKVFEGICKLVDEHKARVAPTIGAIMREAVRQGVSDVVDNEPVTTKVGNESVTTKEGEMNNEASPFV